jgi:hypothetical protein
MWKASALNISHSIPLFNKSKGSEFTYCWRSELPTNVWGVTLFKYFIYHEKNKHMYTYIFMSVDKGIKEYIPNC